MTFQFDSNIGWVERSETHCLAVAFHDGFRVALPILHPEVKR
jgi:hypothetical protein